MGAFRVFCVAHICRDWRAALFWVFSFYFHLLEGGWTPSAHYACILSFHLRKLTLLYKIYTDVSYTIGMPNGMLIFITVVFVNLRKRDTFFSFFVLFLSLFFFSCFHIIPCEVLNTCKINRSLLILAGHFLLIVCWELFGLY